MVRKVEKVKLVSLKKQTLQCTCTYVCVCDVNVLPITLAVNGVGVSKLFCVDNDNIKGISYLFIKLRDIQVHVCEGTFDHTYFS